MEATPEELLIEWPEGTKNLEVLAFQFPPQRLLSEVWSERPKAVSGRTDYEEMKGEVGLDHFEAVRGRDGTTTSPW